MICSSCGTVNEAGRKFCKECATRLAVSCPSCGTANGADAKFCGECATPLGGAAASAPGVARGATAGPGAATASATASASAAPAPVAERRLVSVLFADLVGFTPFAEERDAEDVRDTLTRYFEIASEVVARYGGTVEKFIGDAVMAVWGAPVAREDDAERAVRAALELVDAVRGLGPTIQARAGVLTGEAAVTLGATNQGMVAGDLVNTAARLQSVAPPGAVLVGEPTMRAASAAVAFEEAGEQVLKGKTAPVPAWRALRVVSERGGRNRSEALEAPFVGRDDELRLLKDLFHATSREGRPRLVSVIGPAGIGKSRLAWEFLKYIDGLVEDVWWHDGRSPSYGDGITFWALGEMIRGRAGLAEADDEATTRAKVAGMLATHVPDEADRRWIEPPLLALFGIGTGSSSPEQLFAAWRTFFERLAATAPVVMVFEDLHWADPGTLDFIDHLLDWSKSAPIYLVTLSRPELLERRPDWGAGKRNFVSMHLEPLSDGSMRDLLAGLVPGLPEAAARAIVERADGVPLYAVETVRMLVADGKLVPSDGVYRPSGDLSHLAVPETLTALIGARLDGLDPADRGLVQDAAVLGLSFTPTAVAAISGLSEPDLEPRLEALVRRELLTVQSDPRSPERGQYAFVQALIREVAYNTLSKKDRKARHLAAARHFETLGTDELAGALATHYLAALSNSPEGPEADALAGQARIALKAAADRALQLGAFAQAATYFDQAREITVDPGEVADLLERAGTAAEDAALAEIAEDRLRRALEARRAAGDPGAILRSTILLGRVLASHLKIEAAISLLEPTLEALGPDEPAADDTDRVRLLAQLSRAYFFHEESQRAVEVADRALAAAERLDLVAVVADLLITRGSALGNLGRTYEGLGAIRAGLGLAEEHGSARIALRAQVNLTAFGQSDPAATFETARSALAVAARLGLRNFLQTLLMNAGSTAIEVGEWEWARTEVTAARDGAIDDLPRNLYRWILAGLGSWRGDDVAAELAFLEQWAIEWEDPGARVGLHGLRAEAAYAAGRFVEAADGWLLHAAGDSLNAPFSTKMAGTAALLGRDARRAARALAANEATGAHGRLWTLDRRLLRAGIAALEAPTGLELREFRELAAAYRELGLPWRQAQAVLVALATRAGSEAEVGEPVAEARAILTRLGARPFLALLDRLEAELTADAAGTAASPAAGVTGRRDRAGSSVSAES